MSNGRANKVLVLADIELGIGNGYLTFVIDL